MMGAGIEQAPDLFPAEQVRESLRLLGCGNMEVGARTAERDVIEKPERVGSLGARAPGAFAPLEQVGQVRLNLVGSELIRRTAIVPSQTDHLLDIRLVRA